MGSRANIHVKDSYRQADDTSGIYLYTHWSGYQLPQVLQAALERGQGRWGDTSYLTRIIFCEMVKDEVMETTSYGISTQLEDNDYPILVVDDKSRTVKVAEEGSEREGPYMNEWSYEEFLELDLAPENDPWYVMKRPRIAAV